MVERGRVAIIGAGLGGMVAASFLQRAGFSVTVFEQALAFSRIGAGILLSPNVTKILRRLDLEQALVETGIRPDAFVSRAWDTGDVLYELALDAAAEARFGGPYLNIHRGDLQAILASAVVPGSLRLGHVLKGLDEHAGHVALAFENSATFEADLVIGADGIWSRVREHLFGPRMPCYVGKIAMRAIFPTERLGHLRIRDCTKWWGPDRHVLAYYMSPRRDEVYLMGAIPAGGWAPSDPVMQALPREFAEACEGFHPDLLDAVTAAVDVSVWPILDRPREDRWSSGRVVLLGDACHPVPPFMAAGGGMAIEDAAVLSRCLDGAGDVAEALRTYERTRVPRVAEVQRISVANTWMGSATDPDWLFCYDACEAPLASTADGVHAALVP